jgi:hypothetical protein
MLENIQNSINKQIGDLNSKIINIEQNVATKNQVYDEDE